MHLGSKVLVFIFPSSPLVLSYTCFHLSLVNVADEKNPHSGVIVKMSSIGQKVDDRKVNCSLSTTVLCDYSGAQVRALS